MEIRSKAEFFRLWQAGVLGYKLGTWDHPRDIPQHVPIVGFRQVGVAGGGRFEVCARAEAFRIAATWSAIGLRYVICEVAPDEKGTVQGEVCRGLGGWEGLLGLTPGIRMRDAIKRGLLRPLRGAAVLVVLETYMSPASRDDLDALLDLYPDATVEFTCFGDHDFERGRNTIFWEVRNY